MTGATRPPIWLRLSGPVAAELGGIGTVAELARGVRQDAESVAASGRTPRYTSTHSTALAAALVSLSAVVLSASPARLLRGRS
jgi:Na+/H+-translocating membrane pyrophosphatase